jgi:hypothetical protein
MINIGEELVATYLEHIEGCNFIQQNAYTPDVQGEIDVVGIRLKEPKTIFVCEVAVHLTTGLRYVKDKQPNNVNKLYFDGYIKRIMLWSPIVKKTKEGSKHSQVRDLEDLQIKIVEKYGIELEYIINDKFLDCMHKLRKHANQKTEELKSPVLRLMQIEESLKKHLGL